MSAVVSHADSRLVVTFAPRLLDKICVVVLLLVGVEIAYLAERFLVAKPTSTVSCDRGVGTCVASWGALIGGGGTTLKLPELSDSRMVPGTRVSGEEWVVSAAGTTIHMSSVISNRDVLAAVRKHSADFEAFLKDPTRKNFTATYASVGGPPGWMFVVMALAFIAWGVRWLRGWRAELVFDRVSGTLTIDAHPTLLLGARRRTYGLDEITKIDATRNLTFAYASIGTAVIMVRGAGGKKLFRYRMIADTKKVRAAIAERYKAMDAFCARRDAA